MLTKSYDLLLVDNYDSFTYNLYDYFLQLGVSCLVLRNDEKPLDYFKDLNFKALVLSPGPKKPKDAGLLLPLIEYFFDKKPILGICLGHQGIGEFFGATLVKNDIPVHGKTSLISHKNHPVFETLPPKFEVMRYHSLLIKNLESTPLISIATTVTGEIMAMAHKELPILGFQFHPESILTQYGLEMLNNWLNLNGLSRNKDHPLKP